MITSRDRNKVLQQWYYKKCVKPPEAQLLGNTEQPKLDTSLAAPLDVFLVSNCQRGDEWRWG